MPSIVDGGPNSRGDVSLMNESALGFVSAIAAIVWLGIIGLLHFIKPELDPRTRMISEYACGARGWIMQLAFFCMAVSCWALAAATWPVQPVLGAALLVVCGIGFAGAGVFITDPVGPIGRTQTRSGALHILFAFGVMLIFPIMATFVSWKIDGRVVGTRTRSWLLVLSALAWVGLYGFAAATIRSAGSPGTSIGYFERFLVVTYALWLAIAALLTAE
jgi:hypothetical protein